MPDLTRLAFAFDLGLGGFSDAGNTGSTGL